MELPAGFSYQIISRMGQTMDDGLIVPGHHDGMATFAAADGSTVIVRNHECEADPPESGAFGANFELLGRVRTSLLYDVGQSDRPPLGGTTTLVYDTRLQRLRQHFLSLGGTLRNCAGGLTPWGSWITCEETVDLKSDRLAQDHGYCFEVPADPTLGLAAAIPLRDMGRFRHEAVAVDPSSGIVYETEDMDDGLIYRFLPNSPGDLYQGGRLQALAIRQLPACDTRNWPDQETTITPGVSHDVDWIDLDRVAEADDDLRYRGFAQRAARFARGEGMWYGNDAVYFACTSGGKSQLGQIWRYRRSPHEGQPQERDAPARLELFIESPDTALLENADNLTVAPWGDLFICEDGPGSQRVVGVTQTGQYFPMAKNVLNESELAGVVFSPDGSTMFVNIQNSGLTLAIWGPWRT